MMQEGYRPRDGLAVTRGICLVEIVRTKGLGWAAPWLGRYDTMPIGQFAFTLGRCGPLGELLYTNCLLWSSDWLRLSAQREVVSLRTPARHKLGRG